LKKRKKEGEEERERLGEMYVNEERGRREQSTP